VAVKTSYNNSNVELFKYHVR